ncbi:MAG TPA: hypothetical protein VMT66_03405 [Steroidobacteraceae bacterium]|nr:hypothetical protein [Steroidobacteraceae bacterium]
MRFMSAKVVVAAALLAIGVSACVVAPAPAYHVVAYEAPPPVRYEVVGVAPAPGYFWVGGAWFWEGGRYAWHPGYWQAPRPGYRWVAHSWRAYGNGWRMEPGHWVRG